MADNYLERAMEDYRNGVTAERLKKKAHSAGAKKRKAAEDKRVLIVIGETAGGGEFVRQYCAAGARVAFICGDDRGGSRLAQESGSRFYPCDISDAKALQRSVTMAVNYFSGIDALIFCIGPGEPLPEFDPEEPAVPVADFDSVCDSASRAFFIVATLLTRGRLLVNPSELAPLSLQVVVPSLDYLADDRASRLPFAAASQAVTGMAKYIGKTMENRNIAVTVLQLAAAASVPVACALSISAATASSPMLNRMDLLVPAQEAPAK